MILDSLELYMQLRSGTEPPAIAHRWSYLTCLGAYMARKVWFKFGETDLTTNMFVMLVGDPGARKSTAIKQAVKLFGEAGYTTLAASKSSMEKFLMDLEGQEDEWDKPRKVGRPSKKAAEIDLDMELDEMDTAAEDKSPRHVLIAADEFNNFMGPANTAFLSVLGELWDWDEDRPWDYRLKNSRSVRIWQPTISILGGNTPDMFRQCFPEEVLGQGYMSRQILVQCDRTDVRIAFPEGSNKPLRDRILADLAAMSKLAGPVGLQKEARSMLDTLYRTWQDLDDMRFKSYSSRRYTHLLKLAMLLAVNRKRMEILPVDVIHANTILDHTETFMPKAMGEVGRARNSTAAQKVMQFLFDAKRPVAPKELWTVVRMDLDKTHDLVSVLDGLKVAGRIQVVMQDDKPLYLPNLQGNTKRHTLFTDRNYLRGKELL